MLFESEPIPVPVAFCPKMYQIIDACVCVCEFISRVTTDHEKEERVQGHHRILIRFLIFPCDASIIQFHMFNIYLDIYIHEQDRKCQLSVALNL